MATNGKTIIIADDHATVVMYLSILLNRMGFEIIPTKNGREVLEILENFRPDVIITDYKMPVMDGITLLKTIKQDPRFSHIPTIVMSAYCENPIQEAAFEAGAQGFLAKPIKLSDLNSLIQDAVTYENNNKREKLRCSYGRKVSVDYGGQGQDLFAVTLGEGGVYLRTQKPLPVGTEVTIHLTIDPEQTISLPGTVLYQKTVFNDVFKIDPGMAIQFDTVPATTAATLKKHVTDLLAGDLHEELKDPVLAANAI